MRRSRILGKIRNGQTAMSVCLHFTDPSVYELASLLGFDGIWMDLEHHGYSVETASQLMRAARVGDCDIVARPGKGEFMRMGRLLEMGASGVMYPRCESVAEAKEVVRWAKFAPLGARGFDGGNPDMPYCMGNMADYIAQANRETFILLQVEDPKSVAIIDEIAAVPGIDMLMLGPADFTVLSGIPGQFTHQLVDDAIRAIASAAKRHNKAWAATCGSIERAKELIDLGAGLIFHGGDIVILKNGLEAIRNSFAEKLGIRFPNPMTANRSYLEQ